MPLPVANLTLFELSMFYYGLLLAIIYANHFYGEGRAENNFSVQKEIKDERASNLRFDTVTR